MRSRETSRHLARQWGLPPMHVRPRDVLLPPPSARDQLCSALPLTRGMQSLGSPECPGVSAEPNPEFAAFLGPPVFTRVPQSVSGVSAAHCQGSSECPRSPPLCPDLGFSECPPRSPKCPCLRNALSGVPRVFTEPSPGFAVSPWPPKCPLRSLPPLGSQGCHSPRSTRPGVPRVLSIQPGPDGILLSRLLVRGAPRVAGWVGVGVKGRGQVAPG